MKRKKSQKATTAVEGSYNDLQDRINTEIKDNSLGNSDIWVQDIIPDTPVTNGKAIVHDFTAGKIFEIPFTDDEKGITLGEAVEVKRVTTYEALKYAQAEGSYEYIKALVQNTISEGLNKNQYCFIPATYPDYVIARISTEDPVTYDYTWALFKFPYTIDANENVILGDPEEVTEVKNYEAIKIGTFVIKDEAKKEITTPVMIPNCEDCDGESFTEDKVAKFCREYNAKFRLADKMHVLNQEGDVIGDAVENWTTKSDETITNITGETVTLPKGTWMTTIKVNDENTWKEVENGTLKGASGAYVSRKDADELFKIINSEKRVVKICELISSDKRTKINDLDDPVAISIALVDKPCVANAIATSIKTANKAGRTISNNTLSKLTKIKDNIIESLGEMDNLFHKAKDERSNPTDPVIKKSMKFYLEVDKMEENEFNEKVGKVVDEKLQPIHESLESIKKAVEKDDGKTDHEPTGNGNVKKTEPEPTGKSVEKLEAELAEAKKAQEKQAGRIEDLEKKLGSGSTKSNSLKQTDDTKKSNKSFMDEAGRTGTGRPLPKA